MDNNIKFRIIKNNIFKGLIILISISVIVPLFLIISDIVRKGAPVISWAFLTRSDFPQQMTSFDGSDDFSEFLNNLTDDDSTSGSQTEETKTPEEIEAEKKAAEEEKKRAEYGGVAHAIVGTFMLILVAVVFAVPIGIAAGIFVAENQKSKLTYFVHLSLDILQGVPSIIIGVVGYLWLVKPTPWKYSALAGGIALGFMMLPLIIKSTEETLKLIPYSLKEASMALGVPYYKTMLRVILPSGISGIFTGVLVGIARIAGETAPLLFTTFGSAYLTFDITTRMNALPLLIYNYSMNSYEKNFEMVAWGASLVLMVMVLGINIISRFIVNKFKINF